MVKVTTQIFWFQSSPSPKAGSYPSQAAQVFAFAYVSILSQPEGRELPAPWSSPMCITKFQSSPSPKAGSYLSTSSLSSLLCGVSILSQPEGRELLESLYTTLQLLRVSILSQPEGRELLQKPSGMIWIGRFNPLPARRPGAT